MSFTNEEAVDEAFHRSEEQGGGQPSQSGEYDINTGMRTVPSQGSGSVEYAFSTGGSQQAAKETAVHASSSSEGTSEDTRALQLSNREHGQAGGGIWFTKTSGESKVSVDYYTMQVRYQDESSQSTGNTPSPTINTEARISAQDNLDRICTKMEDLSLWIHSISRTWSDTYHRVIQHHPDANSTNLMLSVTPLSVTCMCELLSKFIFKLKNSLEYSEDFFLWKKQLTIETAERIIHSCRLVYRDFVIFMPVLDSEATSQVRNLASELSATTPVVHDAFVSLHDAKEELEDFYISEECFLGKDPGNDDDPNELTDEFVLENEREWELTEPPNSIEVQNTEMVHTEEEHEEHDQRQYPCNFCNRKMFITGFVTSILLLFISLLIFYLIKSLRQ